MGIGLSANTMNLFQVSGGSESPALSDKSVFPNFLRTVGSTSIRATVFADLMAVAGAESVGVVIDWTSESNKLFSQPTADAFVNAVAGENGLQLGFQVTVKNIDTPEEEVNRAVQNILSSGCRVVFSSGTAADLLAERLACAAHKQLVQHMGPDHTGIVWMMSFHQATKDLTDAELVKIGCTRGEWGAASRGFIGAKAMVVDDGTTPPEPGGRSPAAWYAEYKKRALSYTTTPPDVVDPYASMKMTPYAEMNYDVVRQITERGDC